MPAAAASSASTCSRVVRAQVHAQRHRRRFIVRRDDLPRQARRPCVRISRSSQRGCAHGRGLAAIDACQQRLALAHEAAQQRVDEAGGDALPEHARRIHGDVHDRRARGRASIRSGAAATTSSACTCGCICWPGCSSASTTGASRRYQRRLPARIARTAPRRSAAASTASQRLVGDSARLRAPRYSARAAIASGLRAGCEAAPKRAQSSPSRAVRAPAARSALTNSRAPTGRRPRAAVRARARHLRRRRLRARRRRARARCPARSDSRRLAAVWREAAAQQLQRLAASRVSATGQGLNARMRRSIAARGIASSRCAPRPAMSFAA